MIIKDSHFRRNNLTSGPLISFRHYQVTLKVTNCSFAAQTSTHIHFTEVGNSSLQLADSHFSLQDKHLNQDSYNQLLLVDYSRATVAISVTNCTVNIANGYQGTLMRLHNNHNLLLDIADLRYEPHRDLGNATSQPQPLRSRSAFGLLEADKVSTRIERMNLHDVDLDKTSLIKLDCKGSDDKDDYGSLDIRDSRFQGVSLTHSIVTLSDESSYATGNGCSSVSIRSSTFTDVDSSNNGAIISVNRQFNSNTTSGTPEL